MILKFHLKKSNNNEEYKDMNENYNPNLARCLNIKVTKCPRTRSSFSPKAIIELVQVSGSDITSFCKLDYVLWVLLQFLE